MTEQVEDSGKDILKIGGVCVGILDESEKTTCIYMEG